MNGYSSIFVSDDINLLDKAILISLGPIVALGRAIGRSLMSKDSEENVRKFKEAHEIKFGESMSLKEAEQNLNNLKTLLRVMAKNRRPHGK